ncbi:hypothetical protein DL96DRAFT_1465549 [Flagelloscypha sp. PMI_526]|nr:hypothetical protein DL96DRAFT_1465549 [Flagelloscypha sp. PMI_526]
MPQRGTPGRAGACDISAVTIPDLAGLPAPTGSPSFIGIGIGTQNYTCGSAGTYTSTGAVADIFDIACLASTPAFDTVQDAALANGAPAGARLLGKHFFTPTASGSSPEWDFTASQNNANAFVIAKKDNTVAAPTGSQDIAWLQLSSVSGSLASQIYRLDTREGQPPATCTPGTADITVKYSAKYWFFGSTL